MEIPDLDYLESLNVGRGVAESQGEIDNSNRQYELGGKIRDSLLSVLYPVKHCPVCEQVLARDMFHADTRRVDGLQSLCIKCRALRRKK